MNGDDTKKSDSNKRRALPPHLQGQLEALDGNPDIAGTPEAPAENWAAARRFHRVRKEAEAR